MRYLWLEVAAGALRNWVKVESSGGVGGERVCGN